jgi:signal recognition particle subunit SRP54
MGLPKGFRITPEQHFIKLCHDELITLMGEGDSELDLSGKPSIIMMVGLQGSGKTTTAAKLARRLKAKGHRPMLVAADIYRPAAINQLMNLGNKLGITVFTIKGMKPVDLCVAAVNQARAVNRDVVIFDTAGRLAIDETLMSELDQIKAKTNPQNILYVCDAMVGQDAVRTATEFDRRLNLSGFILTKLDGDARGGAALSIREVTGKPIKFLGMGETMDKLEEFRPAGLADRILGFGDVVGLMKDFEEVIEEKDAEKDAVKMLQGDFTYHDFVKQIAMIRRMGSLRSIMEKLPGMGELLNQIPPEALDDRELDRVEAIIRSMTPKERNFPDILNDSRMARISRGCGRTVEDVQQLHERFLQARSLMGNLGKSGLFGGLPGAPAPANPFAMGRAARRSGQTPSHPFAALAPPTVAAQPEPQKSAEDRIKEALEKRQKQKDLRQNLKKK